MGEEKDVKKLWKNNKEEVPWEHYLEEYQKIDPEEAAARCRIPYDPQSRKFSVRMMGVDYTVSFPDFEVATEEKGFAALRDMVPAKILVAHFLESGCYNPLTGTMITFRESPWGELYHRQFAGRCLSRLAYGFGFKLGQLEAVMQDLGAEKLSSGDLGYRFEFMPGYMMDFLLWEGDDEFPPSAQILFSDNIPPSFVPEDMVVMGDITITTCKQLAAAKAAEKK